MLPTLLSTAIREKKPVTATYEGHYREFCPHVLGYKNGELRVFVYQFGGSSSEGPVSGEWKCFIVANLAGSTIANGPWRTDPIHRHSRSQQCIENVTVQVSS